MAIIQFPTKLPVESRSFGFRRFDLTATSPVTGTTQSVSYGLPKLSCSLTVGTVDELTAGIAQALLMKLKGQSNLLSVWNHARPVPLGTYCDDTPTLLLSSAVAVGDTTMTISGGKALGTLLAGDWLGIGSSSTKQMIMVTDDATANASGVITISFQFSARNAFTSATAIEWNYPTALFRMISSGSSWSNQNVVTTGLIFDLLEDWTI